MARIMTKSWTQFLFLLAVLALHAGWLASAQSVVNSALRPPKGATVAIVVFEDLQCPDCRRVAPLVEEASKTYKIPVVRHDFPLPFHTWSFDAAVFAPSLGSHSKNLSNEFCSSIFFNHLGNTPPTLLVRVERVFPAHRYRPPSFAFPPGQLPAP